MFFRKEVWDVAAKTLRGSREAGLYQYKKTCSPMELPLVRDLGIFWIIFCFNKWSFVSEGIEIEDRWREGVHYGGQIGRFCLTYNGYCEWGWTRAEWTSWI